jgi:hypothetical protein
MSISWYHRCRGGEVFLFLFAVASPAIRLPETKVAVGGERAYAARFGRCQRFAIMRLGHRTAVGFTSRRDVASKTEDPCRVTPFPLLAGECVRLLG